MDLIFLKISHMEREKYVTANDFYPINRSMLYGVDFWNFSSVGNLFPLFVSDGRSYSDPYDDHFSISAMGGWST